MVAANIGSPNRLSYALVDDMVILASRLQDLVKEFDTDILPSAATAARLGAEFKLSRLAVTLVKGKSGR
ncbi:hypothetical protein DFAR_1110074 [Desulfarculales bacterium]